MWRSRFAAGLFAGLLLVYGGRVLVNETTFADRLVAPLLRPDTAGPADVIVVPGAGVIGECIPNDNGLRRVLHAVREYRAGHGRALLIAGGTGMAGCPVAAAMARFAIELGVPAGDVLTETTSRSTHENAERSAALLRAVGARSLRVVTDQLHMARAEASFAHQGFAVERTSVPIYEGHPDNADMLVAGAREAIAIVYYNLRGWTAPAPAGRPVKSATSTMNIAYPDGPIAILGASYAAGWTPVTLAGRRLSNHGIAGQVAPELAARFEQDVVPARPRAVILWGFINGFFRAPHGDEPTRASIRDSYTALVALARRHGIEPVLATEVTVRPAASWLDRPIQWVGDVLGKVSYQDRINADVVAMNRWLSEFGDREGLLVLDFQAALSDSRGWRSRQFALPDGSHITAAGYEALTDLANPVLQRHLAGTTARPTGAAAEPRP